MATLIRDEELEKQLREQRAAWGGDRYDEVWDGVYVMAAFPNDEHQDVVGGLYRVLHSAIQATGLGQVRPGVNVSDRQFEWTKNYRCPDVAVFLNDTAAINAGTHWYAGLDFAVEVISHNDDTRLKIPFYSALGTRELLIVDKFPWKLELYRHDGEMLRFVDVIDPESPKQLTSRVLPVSFGIRPDDERPVIDVIHNETGQRWPV